MNRNGYFGRFGGFYVPEILVTALRELEREYRQRQFLPTVREVREADDSRH